MKVHATRLGAVILGLALCFFAGQMLLQAGVLPYELKIEKVLDNSAEVADLAQSPRGELWVLERVSGIDEGTVHVYVAGAEADSLVVSVMDDCESGLIDVAFAPEYAETGLAFLYYVDNTGKARVDELFFNQGTLTLGSEILDLGTTTLGCRPGGGLEVGPDGKLYVSTGDMENHASGQDDSVKAGKVLRTELNGGIPVDNPTWGEPPVQNEVWTIGFRNAKDLDIDTDGNVYVTDVGDVDSDYADEINEATAGGNCGWSAVEGDDGNDPAYDDPLFYYDTDTSGTDHQVDPQALVKLTGTGLGAEHEDTLVMANMTTDEMQQLVLGGTIEEKLFYDPDWDKDGSIDPDCPYEIEALGRGLDGWLYAANSGTNPGIYRIYRDTPAPREVSAPGSPFHLTVDKDGSNLKIGWEKLEPRDAHLAARNGGQHSEVYQIWEGDFPITASSIPDSVTTTDGDTDGSVRLHRTIAPSAGDHYYVVSAQGDNLEGSLGKHTDGTERVESTDYCGNLGYGVEVGDCMEDFRHPVTGEELRLKDFNPESPTYNQYVNLSDFRGSAIKLDLSADNCYYCQVQAPFHRVLSKMFEPRDVRIISIMHLSLASPHPAIPPEDCPSYVEAWQDIRQETSPILCDTDLDSDGTADMYAQLHGGTGGTCAGVPQNIFIDQGGVIWDFWCGAYEVLPPYVSQLEPEASPETCE